ncbi:response regulator [Piscinibacter sp. HJYY11]|uniref:response regulator n=1 Tax=Piscinibacter sp. HJYY11 TaxID=2801333 RepID=UPI00191FF66D|nr:response regulator [Piscinibacter sp. HJYY11]MBL0727510.1 response regulator [Piscinibacter sp. HJYY11]
MNEPRVLIVDDNPINLELASLVLKTSGFEVATADGAQSALRALAQRRPDVLLLDIQMPHVDGLALLGQLRADASMAGLVVVAFTAYAMKGDRERLLAAGCDGYISKPIEVANFAAQVRSFLKP